VEKKYNNKSKALKERDSSQVTEETEARVSEFEKRRFL